MPAASSADEALVRARGLTKKYGDFTSVAGTSFEVDPGETVGFLGPNGAGKSSTMRMISCVSPPTEGSLSIFGMSAQKHGSAIRARLGVVPQEDALDTELTVGENLYVYGRYFGISRADIRERRSKLLDFIQLADRASAKVEALSGGMRRRLTIARALINEPEILLLDEPTTGLDPAARHLVWERLFQLKQRDVTQVLTTHYMDEAEQLCDRLMVMDRGRIVAEGTPAELIARHATREVLEVRCADADRDQLVEKASRLTTRLEALPDRLLLYVDDGDAALGAVHGIGIRLTGALVRRGSLEDVYLTLTGRALVD
ncbi:Daunorubicin/doxorubicin resistance ATP-binding protein DrrA [Streptomyces sp. YIM 130001]|uniref:ABC transporter ATP-binding protein n=1 Tax=Streptomyces sp. YIM 130001 TaxID=2259644 RepID=UPI000E65CC6D|nr:ABC transporter ATP-binding protein [Streptomyces sp. YIM 130001]RII07922.1 Daunorubicin/doxorubicin resistance ATP-binding protein DrrA [Streptomyces sp. YIM 130001]